VQPRARPRAADAFFRGRAARDDARGDHRGDVRILRTEVSNLAGRPPRADQGKLTRSMRSVITGSGIAVGAHVVPNAALEKLMDTTDEWIRTRSGVQQRYYAGDGVGSAELGIEAAEQALAAAGCSRDDIDAVIFATMTPN